MRPARRFCGIMGALRQIAALAGAASLGACALGPDYAPPTPPEGAAAPLVSVSPAAESTAAIPDAWWRLYDDPVLDGLVDEAFKANADLKAAEANLAAARAIFEGVRIGLYPQTKVEAGGVYGRDPTTDEILEIGGHQPVSQWLFDSLVDVS
jgi:outer membrane protein TolC